MRCALSVHTRFRRLSIKEVKHIAINFYSNVELIMFLDMSVK